MSRLLTNFISSYEARGWKRSQWKVLACRVQSPWHRRQPADRCQPAQGRLEDFCDWICVSKAAACQPAPDFSSRESSDRILALRAIATCRRCRPAFSQREYQSDPACFLALQTNNAGRQAEPIPKKVPEARVQVYHSQQGAFAEMDEFTHHACLGDQLAGRMSLAAQVIRQLIFGRLNVISQSIYAATALGNTCSTYLDQQIG
jgi:hypothetical protein